MEDINNPSRMNGAICGCGMVLMIYGFGCFPTFSDSLPSSAMSLRSYFCLLMIIRRSISTLEIFMIFLMPRLKRRNSGVFRNSSSVRRGSSHALRVSGLSCVRGPSSAMLRSLRFTGELLVSQPPSHDMLQDGCEPFSVGSFSMIISKRLLVKVTE